MFGTYCRLGVPVWSTDREVIRAARRLLSVRARRGRALRAERHAFLRQMLEFRSKPDLFYRGHSSSGQSREVWITRRMDTTSRPPRCVRA